MKRKITTILLAGTLVFGSVIPTFAAAQTPTLASSTQQQYFHAIQSDFTIAFAGDVAVLPEGILGYAQAAYISAATVQKFFGYDLDGMTITVSYQQIPTFDEFVQQTGNLDAEQDGRFPAWGTKTWRTIVSCDDEQVHFEIVLDAITGEIFTAEHRFISPFLETVFESLDVLNEYVNAYLASQNFTGERRREHRQDDTGELMARARAYATEAAANNEIVILRGQLEGEVEHKIIALNAQSYPNQGEIQSNLTRYATELAENIRFFDGDFVIADEIVFTVDNGGSAIAIVQYESGHEVHLRFLLTDHRLLQVDIRRQGDLGEFSHGNSDENGANLPEIRREWRRGAGSVNEELDRQDLLESKITAILEAIFEARREMINSETEAPIRGIRNIQ